MNQENKSLEQQKPINFYAALGNALAVSLAIIGVFVAGLLATSGLTSSDYYSYTNSTLMGLIVCALVILGLVLFFGLTTLLTSKYGWKTTVAAFILQGFVVVVAAIIAAYVISSMSPTNSSPDYPYDGGAVLDGTNKTQ